MSEQDQEKKYEEVRERLESAYDRIAEQYAVSFAEMPARLVALGREFLAALPPQARVLDLGCGPGHHMAWMESQGFRVTGVDLSRAMLVQARMHVRGELFYADMCQLAFSPASFEGIWCCSSFFHLPKSQAPLALAQMRRVLAPGGMLYLSLLEGHGESWQKEAKLAGVVRFFAHYTSEEFEALLIQAGFVSLECARDVADASHTWLNFRARTTNAIFL